MLNSNLLIKFVYSKKASKFLVPPYFWWRFHKTLWPSQNTYMNFTPAGRFIPATGYNLLIQYSKPVHMRVHLINRFEFSIQFGVFHFFHNNFHYDTKEHKQISHSHVCNEYKSRTMKPVIRKVGL